MGWGEFATAVVGSTIGGMFGQQGAKQQSEATLKANRENIAHQKEFAQQGLQWKVADARRAGIHPLAALGAQTHSFSPSSVGDTAPGAATAQMGQDIGRAVRASSSLIDRQVNDLQIESLQQDVAHKKLLNQQLLSTIAKQNMVGPPIPTAHDGLMIPGQGNAIKVNPSETTATMPGKPSQEAAIIPEVGWARTSSGGLAPVPSTDAKNKIEDNFIPQTMHSFRNLIMPNFGSGPKPPKRLLPKGAYDWQWSVMSQEYKPVYGEKDGNLKKLHRKMYPSGYKK